ncbi:DNA translocase FtsK 4TM domain-containing protein, partial [bacterium]|nr:DNA translocase FtsK 4TM domain-containing protein [bacterium]
MAKKSKSRKRKSHSPLRTRIVLAVLLGTGSVLFAIALIAYLQDGNWQASSRELAGNMGRVNFWAARGSVSVVGVIGAWFLAVSAAVASLRLWIGRSLPGVSRRNVIFAAVGVMLASTSVGLIGDTPTAERTLVAGWTGSLFATVLHTLFGGLGAVVAWLGLVAAYLATVGIPIFAPLAGLARPLARLANRMAVAMTRFRAGVAEAFTPVGDPVGTRRRPGIGSW